MRITDLELVALWIQAATPSGREETDRRRLDLSRLKLQVQWIRLQRQILGRCTAISSHTTFGELRPMQCDRHRCHGGDHVAIATEEIRWWPTKGPPT